MATGVGIDSAASEKKMFEQAQKKPAPNNKTGPLTRVLGAMKQTYAIESEYRNRLRDYQRGDIECLIVNIIRK